MGMIAAVEQPDGTLCVVKWTGRVGMLKVGIVTYCGREASPEEGVLQVPVAVLTVSGRTVSSVKRPQVQLRVCQVCKETVLSQ